MNEKLFLGVMSGTSLDGLDMALCRFNYKNKQYKYKIINSITIDYEDEWREKLKNAPQLSAFDLAILNNKYGKYIARNCMEFAPKAIKNKEIVICSHGHTVFHQPEKGITYQLGNGTAIAAQSGVKVISDFRSLDVALGGQGAPLAPTGDFHLFKSYPFCLNIGGIANITIRKLDAVSAYDICPANMVLNYLVKDLNPGYDVDGRLAASGKCIQELLTELNQISFYQQKPPKSLGREWFEKIILPYINKYDNYKKENLLATFVEHIAVQIAKSINDTDIEGQCLVTGGGAFNKFLIQRIQFYSNIELVVPDKQVVEFKEALIFAFLGYLKLNNKINCFAQVTGAKRDSICGTIS